ncbi:hypothetical protein JMJ77_0008935 [Colletotrichum scovillei]|uniref:Uncharacterized protein n=1 Tax=Colletotrichum scovillei TaxID=1209932 RepID=A0A9P7UB88_9PEZI|nr:hypothetical protein JMJ78_0001792 [Colletotrichum scovillei]KAG7041232.1 hypothetical protein JMJ77_0008935 [Colletotrichum scovillei]KAG7061264.1 hypothetical protein JMJ76_0010332 [Colletotrichum scovillei]
MRERYPSDFRPRYG